MKCIVASLFSATTIFVVCAICVAQENAPITPNKQAGRKPAFLSDVSKQLIAQAGVFKSKKPKQWKSYDAAVLDVLAKWTAIYKNWMRRGSPPPPDISPLKLPLTYLTYSLVERASRPPANGRAASRPFENGRGMARIPDTRLYLRAIAKADDSRKIDVLLDYARSTAVGVDLAKNLFSENVSLKRVEHVLRTEMNGNTRLARFQLAFILIDRFAAELSPDVRQLAYAYIRKRQPHGPIGYDGGLFWRTLFKLNSSRARREILLYVNDADSQFAVFRLLYEFAVPSPEVALAVRKKLKPAAKSSLFRDYIYFNTRMRALLMVSDPQAELPAYITRIHSLISDRETVISKLEPGKWFSEETSRIRSQYMELISGLFKAEHTLAKKEIRRLVGDRRISTGYRRWFLSQLGRKHDEAVPKLLKAWFAVESESNCEAMRKEMTYWGPSGQILLKQFPDPAAAQKKP